MFVIVKQESFATVGVGILKVSLLFPVLITGIQREGINDLKCLSI